MARIGSYGEGQNGKEWDGCGEIRREEGIGRNRVERGANEE